MNSAQKTGLFGLIASSAFASSALGVVPWSPSFGNTALFSYTGGEANDGDFGNPTLSPNTFNFSPTTFFAGGGAPNPNTNTDTLTVLLTVNPGQVITSIRIREIGTRNNATLNAVTGTLFVRDLQVPGDAGMRQQSLVASYTPTSWTAEVWMTGLNFTEGQQLSISMTNNLVVAVSSRRIEKTGVTVEVLPAPGVLGLAGVAMLGLGRRRRV